MSAPQQTAGDLRTLVLRRVGEGKRVVLLAPDEALARGLEAARCTVLRDPESLDALTGFAPEVVVAFDGLIERGRGQETFAALAAAAPGAAVLFSFASCASASALLAGLLGRPQPSGLSEREVRDWLSAAGLEVRSREVVVMPHAPSGLSADTEAALRQLLEQLNPEAGVDRLLLGAATSPAPRPATFDLRPPTSDLVSLLVLGDGDALAVDASLASALAQTVRPLQVVCALRREEAGASRLLERAKDLDGVSAAVVVTGDVEPARMAQRAEALAQGQYLALLRAGDVADKGHLARLHGALRRGTQAWAHGLATRADVPPPPLATPLARLAGGHTEACGWLLDRAALGPFPLGFAEGVPAWESLLFARLMALFPPVLLGPTGVERSRVPPEPLGDWSALEARPLRMLTSLAEQLALASPREEPPAGEVVARALGKTLEEKAPKLYGQLKKAARKIL